MCTLPERDSAVVEDVDGTLAAFGDHVPLAREHGCQRPQPRHAPLRAFAIDHS